MRSVNGHRRAALLAVLLIVALPSLALAELSATPATDGDLSPAAVNTGTNVFPTREALNVTIIESQSANIGHDQDLEWQAVAAAMGHTATVVPQSTLDDVANLAGTDILIVSSGVVDLPAYRVTTIQSFLMSGRPAYIQGEYQCDLSSNVAFGTIVAALGGSFSNLGTVAGMLEPMSVLPPLNNDPNAMTSIDGFWYGCAGSGDSTIEPFLQNLDLYFGFVFTPPIAAYGQVVYTTDQDWVREADTRPASVDLMENILTFLGAGGSVATQSARWSDVKALYH